MHAIRDVLYSSSAWFYLLRVRYAMPGTELAYEPSTAYACAMRCLRYAISSSELAYGPYAYAMRWPVLSLAHYSTAFVCAMRCPYGYASATRCPVLSSRAVRPGGDQNDREGANEEGDPARPLGRVVRAA
eukprot:766274-Rhodomonas_salina.1